MRVVSELPTELADQLKRMEQEAYSCLVAGNYKAAERIYEKQYEILRSEEQKLPVDQKYHKGAPLHNWGVSLLLQRKILPGFQKIALAYAEDLLNFPNVEDALKAPAYKTLRSYPLISSEFLERLKELAVRRREQNRIPKDPQELMQDYYREGYADLSASFTVERVRENPVTIDQLKPMIQDQLRKIGHKGKRVFIGGSYRNIALLRYIAQIVENFDNFKAIIPIDLPRLSSRSYDHLIHDVSMEYLKGCSYAIFEVSVPNGHLMEIERASMIKNLKALLVFQQCKPDDKPMITRMVLTTDFQKEGYENLTQLTTKIGRFLGVN